MDVRRCGGSEREVEVRGRCGDMEGGRWEVLGRRLVGELGKLSGVMKLDWWMGDGNEWMNWRVSHLVS